MQFLDPAGHPIRNLVVLFLWWKLLLLLVALCSPGLGYDTSTSLVEAESRKELPVILRHIVSKLVRWDAVYYVKVAERDYLFEQEWAFGWGFTRAIAFGTECLKNAGVNNYEGLEALVGISIAHLAHLLSIIFVYYLSIAVFPKSESAFPFITASLQIISPAGLFLSAPQAESACAALSFAGCLLFVQSRKDNNQVSLGRDLCLLISGIMFGIASTVRSNGILNGLLLLEEALRTFAQLCYNPSFQMLRRLIAAGLGGLIVGFGFLLPQYIAYKDYCGDTAFSPRVWCQRSLPSIYSFVQSHYWNVGPFRYWTISNLPLFMLATPMFAILIASGLWGLSQPASLPPNTKSDTKEERSMSEGISGMSILRNMAIAQLLLAAMTLITAHVQIITRISSAYPLWLWYLAASIQEGRNIGMVVKFMVLYSIIQASLYASFLPPA